MSDKSDHQPHISKSTTQKVTFAHEIHHVTKVFVVVATAADNLDFFKEKRSEINTEL
jgi:hypothetical protein